jgi:hypothetical protein
MEVNVERRKSPRKLLDPIHVADIETTEQPMIIADHGTLLNASASGLLIHVNRRDLNPDLRSPNQSLTTIEGKDVIMKIVEMELKIDARVVRARAIDNTFCEIAVDFSDMASDYWRECLAELLPNVGEIDRVDSSSNPRLGY